MWSLRGRFQPLQMYVTRPAPAEKQLAKHWRLVWSSVETKFKIQKVKCFFGSSFLNVTNCCFSLSFLKVNEESLGFDKRSNLKTTVSPSGKCSRANDSSIDGENKMIRWCDSECNCYHCWFGLSVGLSSPKRMMYGRLSLI